MKQIVIKAAEGLFYVETPQSSATGRTIEAALEKVDPGAPPDKLHACAEILTGLLGPLGHIEVREGLVDTT
jgi:hypothetical protein